jgi:hypothetical protein
MISQSVQLRTTAAFGDVLQIMLEPVAGQWQEKFSLISGSHDVPLVIESVVDGESRWPLSPPWQEAVRERHGDDNVLMAIGRAGRSHWSGSWRIISGSDRVGIEAEIACRIHEPPSFLGSTFRVSSGLEIVSEDEESLVVIAENATITIHTDPGNASIKSAGESLFGVRPAQVIPVRFPDTVSYRFRVFAHHND